VNPQEINQRIAQAKSRYNASKGQADGLLHDAQTLFVSTIAEIIDSQLTEIAQLQGENKKLRTDLDVNKNLTKRDKQIIQETKKK